MPQRGLAACPSKPTYMYNICLHPKSQMTHLPTAVRIYNPRGGKNHVFWIRTCIDILSVYSKVNVGGSAAGDWSIPRCFHWPCQGEGRGRVRNEDVIEILWNPCEKKISEIRNTSFKCIQMSCFHHIDTSPNLDRSRHANSSADDNCLSGFSDSRRLVTSRSQCSCMSWSTAR